MRKDDVFGGIDLNDLIVKLIADQGIAIFQSYGKCGEGIGHTAGSIVGHIFPDDLLVECDFVFPLRSWIDCSCLPTSRAGVGVLLTRKRTGLRNLVTKGKRQQCKS